MGADPITLGMIGLSTFKSYQQLKAGNNAQEYYNELATEKLRQSEVEKRMSLEQMHDLDIQQNADIGAAKNAIAGRGLRVGGSGSTITDKIRRTIARRKSMIAFQSQEKQRSLKYEAASYRKEGRLAKRGSKAEAFTSLLTGGLAAGKRAYDKGDMEWLFGKTT